LLNPALAVEEVEHAANDTTHNKAYIEKGVAGILEWQVDIHPPDTGD